MNDKTRTMPNTDERAGRLRALIWVSLCILLAFAVRIHDVGAQSLWWDESLSLHRAQLPLTDILLNHIYLTDSISTITTIDNHPPLYFLLLAATTHLLGISEFALRLLSVAFSILIVPLLYVTGKRLMNQPSGLFAALIGAVSPMYLWYSHEVRMYMMAPFLCLLSVYAFLRLLAPEETARGRWTTAYAFATAAMLLTHYLTFFILAAEVLMAMLVVMRNSRLRRLAWPLAAVFVIAAAILLYALTIVPPPLPQGGFSFISLPILLRDILNSFSLGLSVNVDDVIFLDALFVLVAMYGLVGAASLRRKGPLPAVLVLVLFFLVPLALTYLAGFVRPLYMNSRHLIIITPAYYLAFGAGLAAIWPRRGLFVTASLVMAVGIVFSWGQYFGNPIYQKDDHRAWGEYLRANVEPGDVVVVDPPHISELYQYYASSDAPWIGLPLLRDPSQQATDVMLNRLTSQYRNIWLALSYTPPWGDPDRLPEAWLDANLTKTDERTFHTYASDVRMVRYATRPLKQSGTPPIDVAADISLGGQLTFLGDDPVSTQAEPGRSLAYSIFLRADEDNREDLKLSLRLADDSGQVWAQTDQVVRSLQPAGSIHTGNVVREDANLFIPVATPPGQYHVQMVIYAAAAGQPLEPSGSSGPVALGQATIIAPEKQPLPSSLPLTSRIDGKAGPLTLIGIHMDASTLAQGSTLAFDTYWRAEQKPTREYLLHASLIDAQGRTLAQHAFPIAAPGAGTLDWAQGDVRRGQHRMALPADLPAGSYSLRLALEDVSDGSILPLQNRWLAAIGIRRPVSVGRISVSARPHSFSVPAISHPLSANLGDKVTFLGYDVALPGGAGSAEPSLHPGQSFSITIYLQARSVMDQSYSIFAHLINENEQIVAQQDLPAGGESFPTTLWQPGEVVSTTLSILVPQQASPGSLTAVVGLYDPKTFARLPLVGASGTIDRIPLFNIRIVP
jgi:hypothetical protein